MQVRLNQKNSKKNILKFSVYFSIIFFLSLSFIILFDNELKNRFSNFFVNNGHRVINQIYLPNEIETIKIDLNFKNYQKLKNNRKNALSKKLAEREDFEWINAKLTINKKKYKVKIRLKGTHSDHYNDPKKWSFNVKLKNKSFNGIKRFTIQPPKTSNFLNEWIFQKAIHYNDLISRRIDFYSLIVNGNKLGLYFFQEDITKQLIENNYLREGPIVSYDKSNWVKDINNEISTENAFLESNIKVDYQNKDKFSQKLFKETAIKKLETLRNKDANLKEIIDIEKLAKLMMLYTLFGSDEFDWRDIKFYYNPLTDLLEPIGKELHLFKDKNNINLSWQLGKTNLDYTKDQKDFHKIFFKNDQFKKIYFNELHKAFKNNLIEKILNQNNEDLKKFSKILNKYYLFYKNEKIFTKNIYSTIKDKINLELVYKLKNFEEETSHKEKDINQFIEKFKNLNLFDIDNKKKQILFKKGEHIIYEQIIFPENYTTIIKPGTKIIFKNNSNFIFNEAINFIGERNNQIYFMSKNTKNTSQSNFISIIKAKKKSIINFANFENLSAPYEKSGIGFLGSLNFYESNLTIENSTFRNNLNGDDYINLVRSKFNIKNIFFENVLYDALDVDFSEGVIHNMIAKNISNDGLDFSGSKVEIKDIFLDTVLDKGISIGENSEIKINNYIIKNSNIGLAIKDLSKLIAKNILFENLNIGVALYQKKIEFGPAIGLLNNLNILNVKNNFLVQENSVLKVDNIEIVITDYDFENL
jgi:hypothetical protein